MTLFIGFDNRAPMPNLEYKRSTPILLRDAEKNEQWLQDRIEENPSILGLGDLTVIKREKRQISGGRIDFLMLDPENDVRFAVEVMLGRLDESHIIRTIEYWDLERSRYPSVEHKAVIVAEDITSRFFNVIGLLNRAIPLIALQLNALVIDSVLTINFTKLLDVTELGAEDPDLPEESRGTANWANRASPASMALIERIIAAIPGDKKKTYNQGHIAVRTTGRNFCWFHPRQSDSVLFYLLVGPDGREQIAGQLASAGITARNRGEKDMTIKVFAGQTDGIETALRGVLERSEKLSRGAEDGEV